MVLVLLLPNPEKVPQSFETNKAGISCRDCLHRCHPLLFLAVHSDHCFDPLSEAEEVASVPQAADCTKSTAMRHYSFNFYIFF